MASSSVQELDGNPKYQFLRRLNSGAFGFVVLARCWEDNTVCAIKFIPRGSRITKNVSREFINHSHLLHPHVIQFREVFLTPHYLAIAMEFAIGGDMFQYVKRRGGLAEPEARWFFQQLIIGIDYCHKKGVVNRDIKLENTLLNGSKRPILKICDFGYSKNQIDSLPKSQVGTPGYAAPEIVMNCRQYDGRLADVWSAGVMLFVMLFCEYPFERPEDANTHHRARLVLERVLNVQYTIPDGIPVSAECKDLLSKMLVGNAAQRYTVQQIQKHPWYLTDLPPDVINMNTECLQLQKHCTGVQNDAQINSIVMQASRSRGSNFEVDNESLDDTAAMDDDYYYA